MPCSEVKGITSQDRPSKEFAGRMVYNGCRFHEDSSESSTTSSEEEKEPESANPDGPILESVPATEEGDLEAARENAASNFE